MNKRDNSRRQRESGCRLEQAMENKSAHGIGKTMAGSITGTHFCARNLPGIFGPARGGSRSYSPHRNFPLWHRRGDGVKNSAFPIMDLPIRPRRLRSSPALRALVRETAPLAADDFILPLFV